ncbi:MAG: hypothetical protein HYV40_02505 [Candidatus Levybacteria bacterium]|nr:hypothetical protein [Candidatus Levybacteria bacterium]
MAEVNIGSEKPNIPAKSNILKKGANPPPAAKRQLPTARLAPENSPTQALANPNKRTAHPDYGFKDDGNPIQTEEHTVHTDGKTVRVTQHGRVIRLRSIGDDSKANYLIDVTNQVEPNQKMRDPKSRTTVRELYDNFEDPTFNNVRESNNGIVVTVTDKFDAEGRKRVYISHLGELIWDENGKGSFPDYEILEGCEFRDEGIYVPYSFNSFRADEFFEREIGQAFSEQKRELAPPALQDPDVIETDFKVK